MLLRRGLKNDNIQDILDVPAGHDNQNRTGDDSVSCVTLFEFFRFESDSFGVCSIFRFATFGSSLKLPNYTTSVSWLSNSRYLTIHCSLDWEYRQIWVEGADDRSLARERAICLRSCERSGLHFEPSSFAYVLSPF